MNALPIGEHQVAFDQVEAAALKLLVTTRNILNALGRMVGTVQHGDKASANVRQLTSDHADSTVKLCREAATHAVKRMNEAPISEPRLAASKVLAESYLTALRKVNVEVDSVPGIELIKAFLPLFHIVLSVRYTDAEKGQAIEAWGRHRARILAGL